MSQWKKIKKLSVFKVENWRVMRRLRQRKCVGHQAVEMSAHCTLTFFRGGREHGCKPALSQKKLLSKKNKKTLPSWLRVDAYISRYLGKNSEAVLFSANLPAWSCTKSIIIKQYLCLTWLTYCSWIHALGNMFWKADTSLRTPFHSVRFLKGVLEICSSLPGVSTPKMIADMDTVSLFNRHVSLYQECSHPSDSGHGHCVTI